MPASPQSPDPHDPRTPEISDSRRLRASPPRMRRQTGEFPEPRSPNERMAKRSRFEARLRLSLLEANDAEVEASGAVQSRASAQTSVRESDGRVVAATDESRISLEGIEARTEIEQSVDGNGVAHDSRTTDDDRGSDEATGWSTSTVSRDRERPFVFASHDPRSRRHLSESRGTELRDGDPEETQITSSREREDVSALGPLHAATIDVVTENMSADELQRMITSLSEALKRKEASSRTTSATRLTLEFLERSRKETEDVLLRVQRQMTMLDEDIQKIAEIIADDPATPNDSETSTLQARRAQMSLHFSDLKANYFAERSDETTKCENSNIVMSRSFPLERLERDLNMTTQFCQFRQRATLLHGNHFDGAPGTDGFRPSDFVSSLAFRPDSNFLATAGVGKRIKIFDCTQLEQDPFENHYPISEISTDEKLSCIVWNPYIRSQLASSDYEGVVQILDVNRGTILQEFDEHEGRAWTVAYCTTNPTFLASGADDGKIKLWSLSMRDSAMTIANNVTLSSANLAGATSQTLQVASQPLGSVCAVTFNPMYGEMLAVGAGPHHVLYYDLRNAVQPLHIFDEHRATVSYVRFMSSTELVSGCPDSSVRLWDVSRMQHVKTFAAHCNQRRFVGLSATREYIAVGSETGSVYAYYKGSRHPVAVYDFPALDAFTGQEVDASNDIVGEDDSRFISSVCWCPQRPSWLVAANGRGSVRLVEIVGE